ncbi:hypothetical protein M9Y09_18705 [Clostridioides difficile]|nr:hypothetical protein [Clostridioides difficile]MCQ7020524.1 hypothetical protein [Clostridioides difficile]
MSYRILAIKPGSTCKKRAGYDGEKQILVMTVDQPADENARYNTIQD